MGATAPDAPLAGAPDAGAPALAGAALAPAAGLAAPEPTVADSLLLQALSSITDRPRQRLAFRKEFERVFFIFYESKSLSKAMH
jgi:hypothetical protein